MKHALALAERGRGAVEPNPMVGAVVLDAAGNLVGEGWHQKFGGPHAEVFALQAAGERARGGTVIVTLEPCCHHGKTPPCTDAVLRSGAKRVVAAMADPFPKVAGGGVKLLRDAGVEVEVGVCETEARRLNAPYLKLLGTGRPWVHLKWAMTLDGKIATRTGDSKWISGEESRAKVHQLRRRVDAVLVGRGTVVADDPLLTARPAGLRTAARVVVTASGDLPERCQLRATAREVPVIVYTTAANAEKLTGWRADGAEVVPLPASDTGLSPNAVLADLGARRFTNVLVEGGAGLLGAFLDANAGDEFHVFIAPKFVGGDKAMSPVGGRGVELMRDALELAECVTEACGGDVYLHGFSPGAVISAT
ncbi:riboflavin biosynthesis protein : Riboflavin biosynthesis protein RibD OS=Pirellula staleyi (strain ATCC 27377 / DSM 6068 / ICPB 4128) GN=Psta_1878 PE=3 SV=1: dCMP_cyt_deam_1: RibD_C [Gemmataceae bacterium]|nr:riboflavin biosynthesis protein : Riboflavin biosynthesis protein RibD OS=Pirellula staleyi (strain ATCC 27377 / DSM 6068 / ICPB 4128) GN=Psta_1878 PE=3 SV=1: dCMP_cyt_deam_1: RibD_C [Gemmataceae bacterium]VTT97266.1 riboflavin biosynthesis protein : Riboflavin biosynthesis protein RibD OS=Pirellula staleyi (strain ATCC 27377 / DSM 6068 / ICPB 4128) GN=Psta_1878 PE=3 SV=1: dCMP_cyt_deam_1: RibD_C [Gemmataceae bacterium]